MDPVAMYDTFLAVLGHEIVTGLAVVVAAAALVRERRLKGQRDEARAAKGGAEEEAERKEAENDQLREVVYRLRRENLDLRGRVLVPEGAQSAVLFGKELS